MTAEMNGFDLLEARVDVSILFNGDRTKNASFRHAVISLLNCQNDNDFEGAYLHDCETLRNERIVEFTTADTFMTGKLSTGLGPSTVLHDSYTGTCSPMNLT